MNAKNECDPPTPDDVQGSISYWIERLKLGDCAAVQPIWERYFDALVRLARSYLAKVAPGVCGGIKDGEDVALSALNSFQ